MVFSTAYLPPVSWFSAMKNDEGWRVEQYENFQKQTLRNRCWIDAPNGKLALTVPVDRSTFVGGKCLTRDVRVSYHQDWQRQHWYALESSYYNSPFFEYLQDDFHPFFEKKWTFLLDFNESLTAKCLELLDLPCKLSRTDEYVGTEVLPASPSLRPYYQVFAHKHGFLPDLSIVDLIFNMGPEAPLLL